VLDDEYLIPRKEETTKKNCIFVARV